MGTDDFVDEWNEETEATDFLEDAPEVEGSEDRPLLLVMSGSRRGLVIEVTDGLLVGRGERASCRIVDPGISRVHVRFDQLADGSYAVVDMGSRNGTRVNGKKMQSAVLQDGDSILIGTSTVLRFSATASSAVFEEPTDHGDVGADRRAHQRVGVVVKVEYPSVEHFLEDYSINISQGGMRICTSQRLAVGDELHMQLSLAGLMKPVPVRGTVRWVRQDEKSGESTAGVKIDQEDEQSKQALEELVKRVIGGTSPSARQRLRVLVADDNPVVKELISTGLERKLRSQPQPLEVETVHALDGERALELLYQGQYDLLIVEAGVPLLDGESLIQRIRSDARFSNLLIAAVSRDGERHKAALLGAGADFFFCKPLRLVDLLQTVRSFLADDAP